jgi:multidrug efflux pump subunit AcrB
MTPFRTIICFLLLSLVGVFLIIRIPIFLTPEPDSNNIYINFSLPNSTPEIIEREATSIIENALSQISDIKNINSYSNYNNASITLEFDKNTDLSLLRFNVASVIRQVYPNLPQNLSYPEITFSSSRLEELKPLIIYNVVTNTFDEHVADKIKLFFQASLLEVDGISDIKLQGIPSKQIVISLDDAKLKLFKLSAENIVDQLMQHQTDIIGGLTRTSEGKVLIMKISSAFKSIKDLENISIKASNFFVKLNQVAKLSVENIQPDNFFRINGKDATTVQIHVNKNTNRIIAARDIRNKINANRVNLPNNVSLHMDYDDSASLNKEVKNILILLISSLLGILILVFMIQRNLRMFLIFLVSIIFCVLITGGLIFILNITIHIYSISALIISFGFIVNNGYIVLNAINKNSYNKMIIPLLAFTLIAIFSLLSIFSLPKNEVVFYKDFSIILIISLLVSFAISLFLIPSLHKVLLRNGFINLNASGNNVRIDL